MPKTKEQKKQIVTEGIKHLDNSETVILVDFTGLPVNEMNILRRTLKSIPQYCFQGY